MSVLGNSHILQLYSAYQHTELTYQPPVPQDLGFRPQASSLKLLGQTRPCLLHSLSFSEARVILKLSTGDIKELSAGSHLCVLKLEFQENLRSPVEEFTFTGKYQIQSSQKVGEGQFLLLVRQEFNHRPPEDFIALQGKYLKLKADVESRQDERITLSGENLALVGLASSTGEVVIETVPRRCVVKEVSYGGARLLVEGHAPAYLQKNFELKLQTLNDGLWHLPGVVLRAQEVDGHKNLAVLGLHYHREKVPAAYLRAIQKVLDRGPNRVPEPRSSGVRTSYIDPVTGKLIRS